MKTSLKELTKEDWDTLFPVELVAHNPGWKQIFETEKQAILQATAPEYIDSLEHFGSSSVPGIRSKPYIDMLMEVPVEFMFDKNLIGQLESVGYTCLTEPEENDPNHYMILVKGYRTDGTHEQVFHIHACPEGHPMMKQRAFRDYLIANPERAEAYDELKIRLAREYRNDRSGYRIAKSEFIEETLKKC